MYKKVIELRKEANEILNSVIDVIIQEHPSLRYTQILWILGIIDNQDRFYEEPAYTIERCYDRIIKASPSFENSCLKEKIDKLIEEIK